MSNGATSSELKRTAQDGHSAKRWSEPLMSMTRPKQASPRFKHWPSQGKGSDSARSDQ